ncbi:MAG TPA: AIR synthase related protein [Solirubrobacteraceae bacterium]|nr:AIR synthase related protein [Solirubrobacteraceae bacterium]
MSDGAGGGGGDDAYRNAGIDYAVLDAGKRLAIDSALATSPLLRARGGRALDESRGEPAFVFELAGQTLALVLEGLGTKSIIARMVAEQQGVNRFRAVAYDAVAAIVNDLCCVGARPLVLNAYFATGTPAWFANHDWHSELIEGWAAACAEAGCVWGGGESPSLPELVAASDIELAGSAVGVVPAGDAAVLGQDLAASDEIVLVASNGLHANGSSLARMVARELDDGFATRLPGGATFGEALLTPSLIYSRLVEAVLDASVPVSYLSHITGHGFLKLMRPPQELTYKITRLPPVPEVLAFLARHTGMSDRASYATLNMGAGFAVYCAPGNGEQVVALAHGLGLQAILAGTVENGPRRVLIEPLGVEFASAELRLGLS